LLWWSLVIIKRGEEVGMGGGDGKVPGQIHVFQETITKIPSSKQFQGQYVAAD